MTSNTFFQIFLYADVFVIGLLTAIAVSHARAHFQPPKKSQPPAEQPEAYRLPEVVKQQMLEAAETSFQNILNQAAAHFHHDLDSSTVQINNLFKKLATEVISGEMERYRQELSKLHDKANSDMGQAEEGIKQYQTELRDKVAQEIEQEKQQLIKQIDTKLADAVSSFLVETLRHNIDLGSQSEYLTAMLEEHKAELVGEVGNEATPK